MASLPANDLADPVVAGEIIILDPAEITIGERLREIDRVHAEALGWSMVKDGQISPIEVCRLPGKSGWHLAGPGGHRLTGALIVGMDGIEAREVSSSRTSRRLREAVENLFRRDLDPIDRAATIAELVHIKREKAGLEATASRDAKVNTHLKREVQHEAGVMLETISSIYGWSDELGAELGFTGRTIRNDLMLYRGLRPSLVTQLRGARHPVLRNASQLRALAKLDAPDQRPVVDALLGTGAYAGQPVAKTVNDAIARVRGSNRAIDPAMKRFSGALGLIKRMSAAERVALFQSPEFHNAIPPEAARLLAPMRRDPQIVQEAGHEALVPQAEVQHEPADRGRDAAGLRGHGSAGGADRSDPVDGGDRGRAGSAGDRLAAAPATIPTEHVPAVSVRKSLANRDHILSLIDGKPYKTLRRHLAGHGLTPDQYRKRYGLAADYPMVADAYAAERRTLAAKLGLGAKA